MLSPVQLLPLEMISIFSLSSSHDDAVAIVVELMTIFDCVLGLSDSILCSSSKKVGFFAWCGVSHSSKVRLCIGVKPLQECGGGFLQASPSRSSCPQAIKKSPISCHTGFS